MSFPSRGPTRVCRALLTGCLEGEESDNLLRLCSCLAEGNLRCCPASSAVQPGMAEDQEPAQPCKTLPPLSAEEHSGNTYRSTQHSQALLSGLVALRDSGTLFDVVLLVEGKAIEAHRILLAASCDYFRSVHSGAGAVMLGVEWGLRRGDSAPAGREVCVSR